MSKTTKQVLFRYNAEEHPELDEWLMSQSNRTQSIIYGLERVIMNTDSQQDLVKYTLSNTLKKPDTELSEPVGDGDE